MDVRKIVGENLRRYRLAAGLSQEELAAQMGVEQGYLSGLEAGRRNPTILTLWHAAVALGIGPARLLEVLDSNPAKNPPRRLSSGPKKTSK